MKHKLTLTLITILIGASQLAAQTLIVKDSNYNTVNTGDTVVVIGNTSTPYLSASFNIVNNGFLGKWVQVEKTVLTTVPGTAGIFDFGFYSV